jgi:tRNA G18 (ribose-2'-O)-methylase SpoU
MIEVQHPDLTNFLRQKKDEGYVLCGLEQTTNSKKLGDYEFPEKCVLLLGQEKQGIPADLLQLLDHTIEIPQYGFIRSLNVHVSGSLLLYEYTKQMQWRSQSMIHNAGSL